MTTLIDTSVAICIRDGHEGVAAQVAGLAVAPAISVVTRVELEGGVYRDPDDREPRRARLDAFLSIVEELPFTGREAEAYAAIVEALGYSRRQILDRMIAATAIVHRLRLITFNSDDFRSISGLEVETWKTPS